MSSIQDSNSLNPHSLNSTALPCNTPQSLQSLSKSLLEEAIRTGHLTLENGDIRELKNTEVLSCIKYVVSGLPSQEAPGLDHIQPSIPQEMLTAQRDEGPVHTPAFPTEQIELFSPQVLQNALRTSPFPTGIWR